MRERGGETAQYGCVPQGASVVGTWWASPPVPTAEDVPPCCSHRDGGSTTMPSTRASAGAIQ